MSNISRRIQEPISFSTQLFALLNFALPKKMIDVEWISTERVIRIIPLLVRLYLSQLTFITNRCELSAMLPETKRMYLKNHKNHSESDRRFAFVVIKYKLILIACIPPVSLQPFPFFFSSFSLFSLLYHPHQQNSPVLLTNLVRHSSSVYSILFLFFFSFFLSGTVYSP